MQWIRRWATKVLIRNCHEIVGSALERVKRLETEMLQLRTDLEALQGSHLSFMRKSVGRLGGRPRASNAETDEGGLDEIRTGDKAALRRHFAPEIARRGPGSNQR